MVARSRSVGYAGSRLEGRVGLEGPFLSSVLEVCMHRYSVNKRKSAGKFKSHIGKTKALNLRGAPMRGGIRL